ncbi:MAG TPA: hypothetical protein VED37_19115 [Ktedonobacteraceae bacterium]|nr:hypothetical protein [Ktedonobacteraceae bacterium]
MDTILIALSFVGGLVGFIIVGMTVTMYFYTRGVLGLTRFRGAKGLSILSARSVPVLVTTGTEKSEINLGLSNDPGAQYARRSMLITAIVLLFAIVAVISVLSASFH